MRGVWARRKRAIVASALFVVIVVYLMACIDGPTYESYNCENRGGIRQAVADRGGYVHSVVCEDGTHWSSTTKVGEWKWHWAHPGK